MNEKEYRVIETIGRIYPSDIYDDMKECYSDGPRTPRRMSVSE